MDNPRDYRSPKGALYDSPGQRPGDESGTKREALKGRHKSEGEANLAPSGLRRSLRPTPQGVALGCHIAPLRGCGTGRRGAIAVVALVCVAVASVVMIIAVRRALGEWKMVRLEAQQVQCRWLAESALDRAAARLASDAKYAGEVWKIPARSLSGKEDVGKEDKAKDGGGAAVKIEVSTPSDQPSRRVVRVQADWPEDAPMRVRISRQATTELPPPAKGK